MKLIKYLAITLLALSSINANAWTLNPSNSSITFVTVKKTNIGESHSFTDFSGSILSNKATVSIKPDSVETMVPIRNERLREFLFETKLYPTIEITANTEAVLENLANGSSKVVSLPAQLSMHGITDKVMLEARVTALNDSTMTVTSIKPILVKASRYKMVEGITKLASLVNDLHISHTIPVSFTLEFNQ